jgi:hypothetical protein
MVPPGECALDHILHGHACASGEAVVVKLQVSLAAIATTTKKVIRQTNLIRLSTPLQVSRLIKRESDSVFEKGILKPLITRLAVIVSRYMFYVRFQGIKYKTGQKRHIFQGFSIEKHAAEILSFGIFLRKS